MTTLNLNPAMYTRPAQDSASRIVEPIRRSLPSQQIVKLSPRLFSHGITQCRDFLIDYLDAPGLEVGLSATTADLMTNHHFSHSLIPTPSLRHALWKQAEPLRFWTADPDDLNNPLTDLLIMPLRSEDGVIAFLEIISEGRKLSSIKERLIEIHDLLAQAFEIYLLQSRNQILERFATEYSTFHSSVHWRFLDCMAKTINGVKDPRCITMEFKGVHALFAQADVIRSTEHRNEAVRSDLIEQCQRAAAILHRYSDASDMPLVKEAERDLQALQNKLEEPFDSKLEFEAYHLFVDRIHPLFLELQGHNHEAKQIIRDYLQRIDSDDGLFCSNRHAYEASIEMINCSISKVLTAREESAQRIVPHYFKKRTTDGISFQIYAGQSLLQHESFRPVHLDNLHLWLLITLCEITKAVAEIRESLPVQMDTAQLIIAYNRVINLAYRKDEKCLDVEHGRHVRYETLKKRFDKSEVLSTRERLTKRGHIAIVYTYETEKWAYLKHFKYLQSRNLIGTQIEDLNLEPMQGIRGVNALRIPIVL